MKFTVENLGKVAKAEIDLKPLTIFIGKNGSGKTYVASALWAFISYIKDKRNFKELLSSQIYDDYVREINRKLEDCKQFETSFEVNAKQLKKIHKNIQNVLNENVNQILNNCFRYNVSDQSFICVEQDKGFDDNFSAKILLEQEIVDTGNNLEVGQDISWISYKIISNKLIHKIRFPKNFGNISKRRLVDLIISELISHVVFKDIIRIFDEIIYIPAARTGLMFGLPNFAQQGLSHNLFEDNDLEYTNLLTMPISDFVLQAHRMPLIRRRNSNNYQEKDFQLDKLLNGKIHVDKNFRYVFTPNGLSKEIPLSATSSLVTEISALEIFKRKMRKGSFIIFEEPEAHLHLSAQREMAKIIAKMINQGCHMLITTHSDTFLQQLNNLIMLNKLVENNPDVLQDFNIEKDETLASDKVAVYDFQCTDEDKSTAIELKLGNYGFVAPSVNEEIISLAKQTNKIIDLIDDKDV